MNLDTGEDVINVDGQLVERDALRIVEALKAYDENLEVLCVDPNMADFNEAPFLICERQADGQLHRIFEVWELNETVLQRIEAADKTRHDVNATLEKMMADQKKQAYQKYQERRLEALDIGKHVLKTKKSKYTFQREDGPQVTVYEDRPVEVK